MGEAKSHCIACVGSRSVPAVSDRDYLTSIGAFYVEQGFTLTTGNAPGADQLFALGGSTVDPTKVELYLPWQSFEHHAIIEGNKVFHAGQALEKHVELARDGSPGFDYGMRGTVKPLFIRNAMILYRFGEKVDLVLAWPNFHQHGWGGTGTRCGWLPRLTFQSFCSTDGATGISSTACARSAGRADSIGSSRSSNAVYFTIIIDERSSLKV